MKIKLLASSLLMTGALMASGTASALGIFATGTFADWQGGTLALFGGAQHFGSTVTDADGDASFALPVLSGALSGAAALINVTLSEEELSGKDIYDVGFSFTQSSGGFIGVGDISYNIITTGGNESINSAKLSTIITGFGTEATKDLSGILTLTKLASLTSINGIPSETVSFNNNSAIHVIDTFFSGTTAHFDDAHNNFTATAVPEPMALLMLGLGLAAFGYSRHRPMPDVEDLMA